MDSLRALVEELRREVGELRQQVNGLRCDVGYWKIGYTDAVRRNTKLQAERDEAKAEIRHLKDDRFGKKAEMESASDRANWLDDPKDQTPPQEEARTAARKSCTKASRLLAGIWKNLLNYYRATSSCSKSWKLQG